MAGCLLAALLVSLVATNGNQVKRVPLAKQLPLVIDDWQGSDVPLGNNEVINASERILNYDDYVFRVYHRGREEVFVYAMYWKQGSISIREIAGHAPDGCWVANGARPGEVYKCVRLLVNGRSTSPAEVREFIFSENRRVHVAWWHIWGNNLVDRGFDRKSLVPTLRELWVWLGKRRGVQQDQLFIRIHTQGDLSSTMQSEPVVAFFQNFPEVFSATPL